MTRVMRLIACAVVAAAALPPSAEAFAQTIAITGGRVFPVSGPPMDNATVLIRNGKIVAVGSGVTVPADARRIDAMGRWVTPGLVDGLTALGLTEVGAVNNTVDLRPRGREGVAAAHRVWLSINPLSVHLAPARDEGVTTVGIAPTGGLIAGQAAVIDLVEAQSAAELIRRAPFAMVAQVESPQGAGVGTRSELVDRLREILLDARTYATRRAEFERGQTRDFAVSRADLEALQPVLRGTLPLVIQAEKRADIEGALTIAREFGLRIMIAGGAEAWMLASQLATVRVPVLTSATNSIPSSFQALGTRQDNAAILRRAGVAVALIGGPTEAFNVRNLKQEAGNAVAYGLSWDEALRAVTQTPALLLGIAEQVGTLEVGKDANVVVWTGDPFEFSTRVERVIIGGREIESLHRQEMLTERYRTLPPRYRAP